MRVREILLSEEEAKPVFEEVKTQLSPSSTGVWFQELQKNRLKKGGILWSRRSKHVVAKEYLKLFGYNTVSEYTGKPTDLVYREDRKKVLHAIREAKQDANGAVKECTFRIVSHETRNSRSQKVVKWIHARAKRCEFEGKNYLMCWNADVTSIKEKEVFSDMVLSMIPGYVFLKEYKETETDKYFTFKYCNERLASVLAESQPNKANYLDRTDRDYFPREIADKFQKNDFEAFKKKSIVISEERFELLNPRMPPKTLVTVKVYFEQVDPSGHVSKCILGVAIDLTSQMELLKVAMQQCEDAIYIKDCAKQFVFANRTYLSMIDVPENTDVTGLTYKELLKKTFKPITSRLQQQIDKIDREDEVLLRDINISRLELRENGKPPHDNSVWKIEKRRIGEIDNSPHILGFAQSTADPKRLAIEVIQHSPQNVCIKNSKFEIIYCNQNYASRRRLPIEQCIGKTDDYFWNHPKYGDQAKRFREKDEEARNLWPQLLAIDSNPELTTTEKRLARRQLLKDVTSFKEKLICEELDAYGNPRLVAKDIITTKWPGIVDGEVVVHVVYTDVTKVTESLEQWHRYTVHAISNEYSLIESVCTALHELSLHDADGGADISVSRAFIDQMYAYLAMGQCGMDFYVKNHLKFMHREIDLSKRISVGEIVKSRVAAFSSLNLSYATFEAPVFSPGIDQLYAFADPVFINAAVTELLRNAQKATKERYLEEYQLQPLNEKRGKISVKCAISQNQTLGCDCIVISVRDTGAACVKGSVADISLNKAIELALKNQGSGRNEPRTDKATGSFGLAFLKSTAHDHNGFFGIKSKHDEYVEAHFGIPLTQPTYGESIDR